jgi:hypothetical protein
VGQHQTQPIIQALLGQQIKDTQVPMVQMEVLIQAGAVVVQAVQGSLRVPAGMADKVFGRQSRVQMCGAVVVVEPDQT